MLSIFFGYLGMDRFYSGHILLGFFKLIILTVVGIWWILEIFLVVNKIDYSDIFKLIILTVVGIWWIVDIFMIAFKIDYSDIEWV